MKKFKYLLFALVIFAGCNTTKFERAQKKFSRLIEAHPQLIAYDSVTVTHIDTSIVTVEVEEDREVTRAKIDTFIHHICDTLYPPAQKEIQIKKLMQNCSLVGLLGSDTITLIDKNTNTKVKLLARGNKLDIANIVTNKETSKNAVIHQKLSYLQKVIDTWHFTAAVVGLILLLLVLWKLK